MPRYIDANALMKEFANFVADSNNSDYADVPTWNDAVSLLGSAPTADVVERKKGKWKSFYHGGTNITFQCSVCGIGGSQSRTNFCPNCGARMEEDT